MATQSDLPTAATAVWYGFLNWLSNNKILFHPWDVRSQPITAWCHTKLYRTLGGPYAGLNMIFLHCLVSYAIRCKQSVTQMGQNVWIWVLTFWDSPVRQNHFRKLLGVFASEQDISRTQHCTNLKVWTKILLQGCY